MATWSIQAPEEGDAVVAADIQAEMTAGQGAVNDLEKESVRRRSLRAEHVPSLTKQAGQQHLEAAAPPYYVTLTYPGWNTVAGWQRLDLAGGATVATLAAAQAPNTALMELTITTVDFGDVDVAGIEVRGSVDCRLIDDSGAAVSGNYVLLIAVQVQDTTGAWHHIARSERPIHATINGAAQVNNQEDLALHVLVVTADLGGAMLANGIRLVAAVLDSVGAVVTRRADIRYASLLAWTLHADGP